MRKILVLNWFIVLLFLSIANASEAILKIDSGGHQGMINDVVVTKNGDIITASKDKSIRVWNTKTSKEKRKILGQIGDGIEGVVSAIALSSNEKYLAVSGAFLLKNDVPMYGTITNLNQLGTIRIYDYQSGQLLKILRSHEDIVLDLVFSEDNQFLVSASGDKTSKIWNIEQDFKLKDTINFHTAAVYSVNIILDNNQHFIFTSGLDKKILMYNMERQNIVQSVELPFQITCMDINQNLIDKTYSIVVGSGHLLYVYDKNLSLTNQFKSNIITEVKFSNDGKYLAVANKGKKIAIDIFETKEFKKINSFLNHDNTVRSIAFLNNQQIVSAGGNLSQIYVWDVLTSKVINTFVGNRKKIWNVGISESKIGFTSNKPKYINESVSLDNFFDLKSFDLKSFEFIDNKFESKSTINGVYSLNHVKNIKTGVSAACLEVLKNNDIHAYISVSPKNGTSHRAYTWYKNYIVTGGDNGFLFIYDINGHPIAQLKGHNGEIWGIGVFNNMLISSDGNSIKIWDLTKLYNKASYKFDTKYIHLVKEYFKNEKGMIISDSDVIKISQQVGDSAIYKSIDIQNFFPIVSMFISNDNEWVLWTKDGFFNASKNGAKYIGYHINQGPYKEAEFVTVDALYSTFYRPDLIQKALAGESLESYAKNINIDTLLKDGLPPEVHILTQTSKTTTQDLDFKVQVCPKGNGGYDNLALMINDMPVSVVDTSRALKLKKKSDDREDCFVYDQTISLIGGKNIIGFKATNKAGNIESKPDYIEVTFDDTNLKNNLKTKLSKISGNQNINDLHILAIAVNKYKDKELQLNYSINDATAMLKTIENVAKPLFNNIHTYKLFDQDVTKQKIIDMFKNIKSTREDVFLLYIAGHGITDEYNGNYYYIPYDFIANDELDNVSSQGVGQKDFMLGLSNITALKSLVLLDTCNSGSFVEAELQKTTTNRLAKATGRATISASSKSQVALEGFENHGVFTYTLLEALKGKAYNGDNTITTNELSDYVEDTLPDRTYKKWGYRQMPQKSLYGEDFSLGRK